MRTPVENQVRAGGGDMTRRNLLEHTSGVRRQRTERGAFLDLRGRPCGECEREEGEKDGAQGRSPRPGQ
jgi:CubicO group peptidase (beta-lactamase class C family)